MAVGNRAPWDIFREGKDGERERPGTLFGTHLRPMGLNVLGYQSHLGIVAILPVPRRILLKVIAYVPYFNGKSDVNVATVGYAVFQLNANGWRDKRESQLPCL